MTDRSPVWIGLCDMALAVLAIVIVAVNPPQTKANGVQEKAEYLLSLEWDVSHDADVDIHLMPPSRKPVFYASRDVGCATLDRDNRGFIDSIITLADGSQTQVDSNKETIALRCVEPGHYDLGANLYADHDSAIDHRAIGLKIHAEILGLNPSVRVVFAKDFVLDYVGQTVNWASFDMARNGQITLGDPPLAPITASYQKEVAEP
ncbi:MAG: hypothetical protein JO107_10540 [Hyphomicrobiales bacterium]|nr:hypothetical protein [Hyphomicrobiales bacterium]MBV8663528.1 hypothetical protein [Hyphomicrobiales bacterium]